MKIIQRSELIEHTAHRRDFRWRHSAGWSGFSFDCDADGNVDEAELQPAARDNYRKCLDGTHDVIDEGVRTDTSCYRQPAIGRCECGREVWLDGFTCPCDCGRDYNSAGQLLAPREQWGEETGEHWTECF